MSYELGKIVNNLISKDTAGLCEDGHFETKKRVVV